MLDVIVDLSHWQGGPSGGPVDFTAVKSAGIAAVILKATQGERWIDNKFVERVLAAKQAGLLVGAYHFVDATDPMLQANHFLSIAGAVDRLAVDVEFNGIGDTVTVEQAAEFVARVQMSSGKLPLVYLNRYGPQGDGSGLPNGVLARCDLWLAEYSANGPVLPLGWDNWTLWQYTETGAVPGVAGVCDRSRYNGTLDQLTEWWTM